MTADQAVKYINDHTWSSTRLGLDRTRTLLKRLHDPQKQLKFVHVAGTNGKGSTCAMTGSILKEAGYRVGLYPSPYIEEFNERIQVNGEMIPDEDLAELTGIVAAEADQMKDHPSQFEIITAIGMLYFLKKRCDIVVLEVGMGGRLDSTNVIDPPLTAVITNIGLDHMEYLDEMIKACEAEMVKRAMPLFDRFLHITDIKGISSLSAIIIISEIGADMSVFESDKQLVSWAGLAPANNESANKKKSVRIAKAGQYLKPLLVQCALSAIADKQSYFGIKYSQIKKRRGHKKAIIAIARMILVSIYHMIETGESFNPSDYESLMNPKPKKNKELTLDKALSFLQSQGYDISSILMTA